MAVARRLDVPATDAVVDGQVRHRAGLARAPQVAGGVSSRLLGTKIVSEPRPADRHIPQPDNPRGKQPLPRQTAIAGGLAPAFLASLEVPRCRSVSTKRILDGAFAQRYGVAAYNIVNDLTLDAVMQAAESLSAPVMTRHP